MKRRTKRFSRGFTSAVLTRNLEISVAERSFHAYLGGYRFVQTDVDECE